MKEYRVIVVDVRRPSSIARRRRPSFVPVVSSSVVRGFFFFQERKKSKYFESESKHMFLERVALLGSPLRILAFDLCQ